MIPLISWIMKKLYVYHSLQNILRFATMLIIGVTYPVKVWRHTRSCYYDEPIFRKTLKNIQIFLLWLPIPREAQVAYQYKNLKNKDCLLRSFLKC